MASDLSRTEGGICSNCGQQRPLEELLAYWPPFQPERRRYVCRPSMPIGHFLSCFRDIVEPAGEHTIALAATLGRSPA